MPNIPTYDDDQDGGIVLQMVRSDCAECSNTGVWKTGIDKSTGKMIRVRCSCAWAGRGRRNAR